MRGATHLINEVVNDEEAKTGAGSIRGIAAAVEAIAGEREILGSDAGTEVAHVNAVGAICGTRTGHFHRRAGRILARVRDEVLERLGEAFRVVTHKGVVDAHQTHVARLSLIHI